MAINEGFCFLKMIKCRRRQATDPQKLKEIVNGRFFVFCWWKRKRWKRKRKRLKNNRFHIPGWKSTDNLHLTTQFSIRTMIIWPNFTVFLIYII